MLKLQHILGTMFDNKQFKCKHVGIQDNPKDEEKFNQVEKVQQQIEDGMKHRGDGIRFH